MNNLRPLIQIADKLAPSWTANLAYKFLTNPRFHKLRPFEKEAIAKAEKEDIPILGFQIRTYKWTGGDKKILLIHGWEGQGGNFGMLIAPLQALGYTVYAFDGPSHGFSSKGKTSLFEFGEVVAALFKRFQVQDAISHSFGSVATSFALWNHRDIAIQKLIMITTPDRFEDRVKDVSQLVGVSDRTQKRLMDRIARETGYDPYDLAVSTYSNDLNVQEALIIHDQDDRVIPIAQSQSVADTWKVARLVKIANTGHFRILRDEQTVKLVESFLVSG
ncbi:MAG: alpha/beta hydrolase [Bacteroidota bacterium]